MLPIIVRHLTKQFSDGTRGLDDVSVHLRAGERVVLLGPNGAGKSTLLRCIAGLEPPTSGSVQVGPHVFDARSHLRRARRVRQVVGLVFQQFHLIGPLSVFHNVLHGALGRSRGPHWWWPSTAPQAERQRVMRCLEQVGLAELATRRAETLSGGQQQRVAIARVLMQDTPVVLADEPVASLDPGAGREVMELLWRVLKGRTVICSLHQLDLALQYGERIVALRDGQVALDTPGAGLSLEALRALYPARGGARPGMPDPGVALPTAVGAAPGAIHDGPR